MSPDQTKDAEGSPAEATAEKEHTVCTVAWCPVCMAVTATRPLHPEMVDHVLKAGAEFLLAIRALLDTRADEVSGEQNGKASTKLEKIDLG
jgi:hypothetical protein